MRPLTKYICPLSAILALSGCGALGPLLPRGTTTVRLVNNGDFAVDVTLYIDDEQDVPELVLTELGTELQYDIAAGASVSFSRNCDALQAVIVDQVDLILIGEIGPEASSGVLRDGSDFSCGDTITFTFDHSDLIVDFDVSASVN